jgi:hypothetical protein
MTAVCNFSSYSALARAFSAFRFLRSVRNEAVPVNALTMPATNAMTSKSDITEWFLG